MQAKKRQSSRRDSASNMHFYGSVEHSIDEKNRITVPAQFRAGVGEKFFLCKGMNDKCLWILPENEFKTLLDRMKEKVPKSDRQGQKWVAMFTESTCDRQLDRQNRIALPPQLLDYAGITGKVKIFGQNERIEIWALERWNEEMTQDFSELSSQMFSIYNI
jgi:MraZ protein